MRAANILGVNLLLGERLEERIRDLVRKVVQLQVAQRVDAGANEGRRVGDVLAGERRPGITRALKNTGSINQTSAQHKDVEGLPFRILRIGRRCSCLTQDRVHQPVHMRCSRSHCLNVKMVGTSV